VRPARADGDLADAEEGLLADYPVKAALRVQKRHFERATAAERAHNN
jgi:hypothetical protein